jgi:hypothetical protein
MVKTVESKADRLVAVLQRQSLEAQAVRCPVYRALPLAHQEVAIGSLIKFT